MMRRTPPVASDIFPSPGVYAWVEVPGMFGFQWPFAPGVAEAGLKSPLKRAQLIYGCSRPQA